MIMAPAMAVMHEQVHQRTSQNQQVREHPKHMSGVLGEQEKSADREETEANDPGRRSPPRLFLMVVLHSDQPPRAAQRAKKL